MKTVYKYPVGISGGDVCVIRAPDYFYPLYVGLQGGEVFLWAMVDTEAPPAEHRVCVAGTGHKLLDDMDSGRHVGTVLLFGGTLVLHFFWLD